jgi:addiction module HigA family antidote
MIKSMADEYFVTGGPAVRPAHPGRILKGILEGSGIPLAHFAKHLGVSRPTVYALINETRPLTVDMAARLSRAFGNSTRFWLNLQAIHDAWRAERAAADMDIEPIACGAVA